MSSISTSEASLVKIKQDLESIISENPANSNTAKEVTIAKVFLTAINNNLTIQAEPEDAPIHKIEGFTVFTTPEGVNIAKVFNSCRHDGWHPTHLATTLRGHHKICLIRDPNPFGALKFEFQEVVGDRLHFCDEEAGIEYSDPISSYTNRGWVKK